VFRIVAQMRQESIVELRADETRIQALAIALAEEWKLEDLLLV
jgi:hypothetical protein